jgi:hypothetical protein
LNSICCDGGGNADKRLAVEGSLGKSDFREGTMENGFFGKEEGFLDGGPREGN